MALPHSADLRLLVFDLDGTLIDSRQDLCNSVNATLDHLGKPHLPDAVIASYIGDGASMLVRRALGDPEGDIHDEEYLQNALTFFLDYYRIHKLDFTYAYDGVLQSLEAIRAAQPHLKMAVLTNKPVNPSRDICRALGLEPFFFQNYGGNSFHSKKPDPHGLQTLMQEASASPGQTVMIGDSIVDILTAQNAGAWSLGCTFGLSSVTLAMDVPSLTCDSPQDWATLFA
ncbi:HAD family hydrolase [Terriglobus tenax]|uniref:HAD family hydrolase n=1 Tax=Terriglobus tenax TaxID=1111115 RepID=UPI0021DFAA51|nr:HAD-IA family hydrolase [Terriglobus tenax]